jgi:hypothetical protein
MALPLWQGEAELDLRRRMDEVVAKMNEVGVQVIYADALKVGMGGIKRRKGCLFCMINQQESPPYRPILHPAPRIRARSGHEPAGHS